MMPDEASARELILKLFRTYEEQGDPFRFTVAGFCIWPIYRFRIALRLLAHAGGDSFTEPSQETRPSVPAALRELLGSVPREVKGLSGSRRSIRGVIGKSGPGARRDTIDGRRMDAYFDFLVPALRDFVMCEPFASHEDSSPYPSLFDEYAYPARALIYPFLYRRAARIELQMLDDLAGCLATSDFARAFGAPADLSRLGLVARFLADMRYWRLLFRWVRPGLFLVVCSYGQEAPVAAARSLGIPTWELQHGMIGEHHFGYNYSAGARPHRHELPLPERIFTFGRFFSEALVSGGYWTNDQVTEMGFPRLAYFDRGTKTARAGAAPRAFNILVSTQWTLEDEYYEFLRQLAPSVPPDVRIVINPHPRSLQRHVDRLRSLAGEGVEVMDKSGSMYHRLGQVDLHCSAYSTTLFESAGLGIPTVVIGLEGWTNAGVLVDRGAALFAQDAASLARIVARSVSEPAFFATWTEKTRKEGSYFFEPFDIERAAELLRPPPGRA